MIILKQATRILKYIVIDPGTIQRKKPEISEQSATRIKPSSVVASQAAVTPQITTVKILANHTEKLLVRIRLTTKAILKPQKIYKHNCLAGGIALLIQQQISAIVANIPPVIPITVAMLEKVKRLAKRKPVSKIISR